jgi:mevalonate kinase
MIISSAPGKCILLGEHAVVYGYPAIAMAINMRSFCSIADTNNQFEFVLPDQGFSWKNSNPNMNLKKFPKRYGQFSKILSKFLKDYQINFKKISIQIQSELWMGSGLGSSASTAIAFLHAISNKFDLNLSAHKINQYGFEMEKLVHGTPSGIDNTICTYGGIMVFQNGIREILTAPKLPLLITNSGIDHNTGKVINSLQKNSDCSNILFQEIGELVEEGISAIKSQNYKKMGELFNQNQIFLSKMGLSTKKIDEIISISMENGAYGAKLTGAGAGGSVITIGDLDDLQKIQILLQKKAYLSKISYLDYKGMCSESKSRIIKSAK